MNMKQRVVGLSAALAITLGASTAVHALKLVPESGSNPATDTDAVESITYAKETLLKGSANVTAASDKADKTIYYNIARDHFVSAPPGVTGSTGDTYVLSYTLEGMVFQATVVAPTGFTVAASGAAGDKEVVFREEDGEIGADAITLTAKFAVSEDGGSITMMARNQDLEAILGGGRGTKTHGPVTINVQPALKEAVMPMEPAPIARASSEFKNLGGSTTVPMLRTSLGTVEIGVMSPSREAAGSDAAINADDSDVESLSDITSVIDVDGSPANPVTFSGDFSFLKTLALADKASTGAQCTGALTELRKPSDSDPKMLTDETMPKGAQTFELDADADGTANNMLQHLCIEVDGETMIPKTAPYMVMTNYVGLTDAAFPPMGMTHELAMIDRDGTAVHLPYLTTYEQYNHRITLRNRSGQPTTWSFTFAPEVGVDAMPGEMATGELMAGETKVLRVTDVVELTGGNRTAASVTLPLPPTAVDVSTTLVNKTGGTATVTVHLSDDGL